MCRHFFLLLSAAVFLGADADPGAVLKKGRLLVASMDYPERIAMFSIRTNGTVEKLWNVSSHRPDLLFSNCYFAFDTIRQMIYIPTEKYLQGINVHTGNITETPNSIRAFFTSLDYDSTQRTLYGVCTGNDRFDWCELELEANATQNSAPGKVVFRYPLTACIELGPTDCIGDYVAERSLFFYQTGASVQYARAINTTNGKEVWNGITNGSCLHYDSVSGKLYAVSSVSDINDWYGLFLVHENGKEQEKVLDFPKGLGLATVGTCAIARQDRTLFVLMRNMQGETMPTDLFGIDLATMKFARFSVPEFKKFQSFEFMTHMMYVPDESWVN